MISIIIPIYNAEQYLSACLDSIIAQITDHPLQLILVDDGSTDNSLTIAKRYAERYGEDAKRQVLLFTQKHAGQSAARNFGLKHVQGEYIAFVDADDRLAPNWCEKHLKAIDGVDYVQSGYRRTSIKQEESGWHIGIQRLPKNRYQFTMAYARLYRRDCIEKYHLRFPEGMIYEDVVFSVDLWLTPATCRMLKHTGYLYTRNPNSTTAKVQLKAQQRLAQELHSKLPYQSFKGKMIIYYTLIRLYFHFKKQ